MSIHPISGSTAPVAASPAHPSITQEVSQGVSVEKKPAPGSTSSPSTTVSISNAAKAALQEATETAAQTAKEARHGDLQAQRLLARTT